MDRKPRLLDDTCLMFLLAGSLFSLMVFVGSYLYAGTLIPSTKYDTAAGAVVTWTIWAALVAMPPITITLLMWRFRGRGR